MVNRTALVLMVSTFLALPAQGQSATENEPSVLTVTGFGEVRIAPDECYPSAKVGHIGTEG